MGIDHSDEVGWPAVALPTWHEPSRELTDSDAMRARHAVRVESAKLGTRPLWMRALETRSA